MSDGLGRRQDRADSRRDPAPFLQQAPKPAAAPLQADKPPVPIEVRRALRMLETVINHCVHDIDLAPAS